MRRNIVHIGADELNYEIREIVKIGKNIESMGQQITWENIGDPVQKGEKIPDWIKNIVSNLALQDQSYAYCDTIGIEETRQFLANKVNERNGIKITPEDIIFFNGLGDAVAKVFSFLKREARVIGPSPAYSTHSSAEGAHSGYDHLTYNLDPNNAWMPDIDDLYKKVKYNDSIAGILMINPDNPTGAVYSKEILSIIVDIANKFNVFILSDEIYSHIVYDKSMTCHLSEVIGNTCGIAMRGISKEIPWPGSRCGWLEVFNKKNNPIFTRYIKSLIDAKMLEVCSTTLPQMTIPLIMGDRRYLDHLKMRNDTFAQRSHECYEIFSKNQEIIVHPAKGAFYMTILFKDSVLNNKMKLPIKYNTIKEYIEQITKDVQPDKRFVYYLLANCGICVVPLSSFCCQRHGFRVTLLECDDNKRQWTFKTISEKITEFVSSV